MKKLCLSLIALVFCTAIFAANVQLTIHLKNGDVISGKTTLAKINVVSSYGTLNIPIEQITNLRFGITSDHSKDALVLADLNKLNNSNEIAAKPIYEKLLAMGSPILATVKSFTENNNYSISENEHYTVEQLLAELYKSANLTEGSPVEDAVTFGNNNFIEGSIQFNDIVVQSEYGNLTFKKEKIESLDISIVDETANLGNGQFRLKGNTNISGNDKNGWVNTGITLKQGDNFSITATGKVVLKSLSGGIFNPNGYFSGIKNGAYTDDMEIKYGSVVYKIGDFGTIQTAGSKYDGKAETDGVLYISIYETVYDKTNSGNYTVTVKKK